MADVLEKEDLDLELFGYPSRFREYTNLFLESRISSPRKDEEIDSKWRLEPRGLPDFFVDCRIAECIGILELRPNVLGPHTTECVDAMLALPPSPVALCGGILPKDPHGIEGHILPLVLRLRLGPFRGGRRRHTTMMTTERKFRQVAELVRHRLRTQVVRAARHIVDHPRSGRLLPRPGWAPHRPVIRIPRDPAHRRHRPDRPRARLLLARRPRPPEHRPPAVLTALEQGQPGITTTQLDAVAAALSLDPTALLNGREIARPVPSVFLRHAPMQDFDDGDAPVLDDALEQGRSLADLRALLAEPAAVLQAATFAQRDASADRSDAPAQDGYRLAREVRKALGDPEGPLGDVGALVEERFGVAILVRTLASSRVTAAGVRAGTSAAIVLGARDPQRAQNPLLARVHLPHELCHVLFDPSPGGLHIVVDAVADRKIHAAEQRARAFAAEILLPLDGLTRMLGAPREVNEPGVALDLVTRARSRFGTPHEIAVNHLCNLRFVDRRQRAWLEAERTTFAGAPPPTTLPDVDAPSRLVAQLVERAHRDGLLTDGEARAILGLDRLAALPWDEVLEMMSAGVARAQQPTWASWHVGLASSNPS